MMGRDAHSIIESDRQRFIYYVRTLLKGSAQEDAEDVVHDVLIKILDRPDLPAPEFLLAYIYRSLKNRVIDYLRTRKPMTSLDTDTEAGSLIDLLRDSGPDGLAVLLSQERSKVLFEALETLGEMEKRVIIAHEFEGIPFKTLSQMWDIPLNTLLSHKSRAMNKLKKYFF